jgi:hypothetical protein
VQKIKRLVALGNSLYCFLINVDSIEQKKKKGPVGGGGFSYCEYHFKMTLVSLQVADGELPLVASHG